jgi:multidrug efflux pump subunit AcrB
MIALVRIALSRPYTFVVLALLLLIIGPLAALRTPTDIFPDIRIPVIGVVWQYTGLPPDQMAGRITTPFQRALTTTVNDIEHIVANSYNGFGIVKIFFQPNVDIRTANAQVTAISQTLIKQMPPGATPPLILNYSASTVPIRISPTSASTSCARRWSRCPAPRSLIRSAASSVRCRSISIRRHCSRAGSPGRTWPTRWPRKT